MNSQSEKQSMIAHKAAPLIGVLEADSAVLEYLRSVLTDRFNLSVYSTSLELNRNLREQAPPDLLLIDWDVVHSESERDVLGLLAGIHAAHPGMPIIMLACSAEMNDVVAAARMGAVDVILKPFRKGEIDRAVERYMKVAERQEGGDEVREIVLSENISFIRTSQRTREIESQCRLIARTDIPVLILGESGTGKELAAMLIHQLSVRSKHCFLKVNCAAMPADLLESELFGYEQGAFTGAIKSKPGKFEICNHGTIFLDEIGEMPPQLQAKLLHILQDGCFSRLGGRSTMTVDVRVVAATNVDIKAAIAQKTLREDLYYRLNGFTVAMPPLRERTDEIPVLAQYFMRRIAAKSEREPLPIPPVLMQALVSYRWPGNVRELESTVKRYFVLGDAQTIIDELCPLGGAKLPRPKLESDGGEANLKSLVRNLKGNAEAAAIAQTLEATGWNRKAAAKKLQISYKALLYKIKQYNLAPKSNFASYGPIPGSDALMPPVGLLPASGG